MSVVKQLNLLDAIRKEHPEGIVEGFSKRPLVTLVELGSQDFRSPEMIDLLKRYWKPSDDDVLYIINLDKVDVLTPSAAKILVESVPELAAEYKKPIFFRAVRAYVAEALNIAAITCDPPIPIWIEEKGGEFRLVGKLPGRFENLVAKLEEAGCPCSASSIALHTTGETSKKTINKLSVYLQEMVTLGLVGRIKENAGATQNRERGWTYLYHRPDDQSLMNMPLVDHP